MVSVNLVYKDGSKFFVGEFPELIQAEKWLVEERTRPYWDSETVIEINDRTAQAKAEREKIERELLARIEKGQSDRKKIKDAIKAKPKTIGEVSALLDLIVSHLGLDQD